MPDMRIFVVLDPHSMEQAALEWGEKIALALKEHRSYDVTLHVYCCMNEESSSGTTTASKKEAHAQDQLEQWIQRLVSKTRSLGIGVNTETEWAENWHNAITDAVVRSESNLVVKNLTHHSRLVRLTRKTADWQLLGNAERPVFLVAAGPPASIDNLIVAIKPDPDEQIYEKANEHVLATSHRMADDLGAEVHAVACHADDRYPDRQKFADRCGLERNQVHVMSGVPEKVIASFAIELDSDILVIASVAGSDKALLGNTAQKVIDELDVNILVLPIA